MAVITAPVTLPADPNPNQQRYGLFNAVNGPLELPIHARNGGLEYTTPLCDLPGGYEVNCLDDLATKTFTNGPTTITGAPFVVLASMLCGTFGFNEAEWNRMVTEKLRAGEQAVVERIFSTSDFGQTPGLANNPDAQQLTAAASVAAGIATLEGWLYAQYGPTGVLHIPISAAAFVLNSDFVYKDGQVWRTKSGTAVSFGNYAGQDAAGENPDAGHTNFWITGQMSVWRTPDSDIFVSPYGASIDKVSNQIRMFAEREYVLAFDCYVAAVDVTLEA